MNNTNWKARTPKQDRGIKTKEKIVKAAMKVFSSRGFYETNSKLIAAEAGVAAGCFYSYFKDKKDVFIEALKIYNQQFNDKVNENLEIASQKISVDKREFLRTIIYSVLDAHSTYSGFYKELWALRFSDPDVMNIMDFQTHYSIKNIQDYLQVKISDITLTDLEAASVLIFSSIQSVANTLLFSRTNIGEDRLIEGLVDMYLKYMFY
jgi:AcrR family transcriptional regulator